MENRILKDYMERYRKTCIEKDKGDKGKMAKIFVVLELFSVGQNSLLGSLTSLF